MISLRFKQSALIQLQVFIRNYENAFLELYKDTGIFNEEFIIQNYKEIVVRLYSEILVNIETKLTKNKVLGRKQKEKLSELNFYVGQRLIIVYFTEQKQKKLRLVESILIDRKPIIF